MPSLTTSVNYILVITTAVLSTSIICISSHPTSSSSVHHSPTTQSPTTKPPYLFDSREPHKESSSEEDDWAWYYSDYSSEEDTCPPGEFWHIRGKRCVPFKCPRANYMRDWKTGACLYDVGGEIKQFGNGGGRTVLVTRGVLSPSRQQIGSRRNRYDKTPNWKIVNQRKRLPVDEDTGAPIRTIGLIG